MSQWKNFHSQLTAVLQDAADALWRGLVYFLVAAVGFGILAGPHNLLSRLLIQYAAVLLIIYALVRVVLQAVGIRIRR